MKNQSLRSPSGNGFPVSGKVYFLGHYQRFGKAFSRHRLPGGSEEPAELLDAGEVGATETVADIVAHLLSGQAAYEHNILRFKN